MNYNLLQLSCSYSHQKNALGQLHLPWKSDGVFSSAIAYFHSLKVYCLRTQIPNTLVSSKICSRQFNLPHVFQLIQLTCRRFIKLIYEVDPLICPNGEVEMPVVSGLVDVLHYARRSEGGHINDSLLIRLININVCGYERQCVG